VAAQGGRVGPTALGILSSGGLARKTLTNASLWEQPAIANPQSVAA